MPIPILVAISISLQTAFLITLHLARSCNLSPQLNTEYTKFPFNQIWQSNQNTFDLFVIFVGLPIPLNFSIQDQKLIWAGASPVKSDLIIEERQRPKSSALSRKVCARKRCLHQTRSRASGSELIGRQRKKWAEQVSERL